MAAIFQAIGTQSAGTASVAVAWPAHVTGDLGIIVIETGGEGTTLAVPSGWTAVPGSPVTDVATVAGSKLQVWYRFAASNAEANVNTGDSGDHQVARIVTFRGINSTTPFDATPVTAIKTTASTTVTWDSITTVTANALIVFIATRPDDSTSTTNFGVPVNANLTGLAEAGEGGTNAGHGGGFTVGYGTRGVAGAIGTTTCTSVASTTNAEMVIALRPSLRTGTLAATESGSDTFVGSGDVIVKGSLAATESGSDTFAATGTVTAGGISGTMAVTETGSDTFAGAGDVIVKGTLSATESGSDTFAGAGDVIVSGSMAATETGEDTFNASGDVIVQGAMAATETGSDIFAATGGTVTLGTMAATESGSDTLAASGTVLVQGAMAATESGQDVMAATGVVTTPGIVGTMSATESGADFTDGYTYPEYVEPPGYYDGWTGVVTDDPPAIDGGGGPGNAVSIQRRNRRGWSYERAVYERSLQEFDRQRREELERIAQTFVDSGQSQAQRIARKLVDYTGELSQVKSLQRELAKLEAAQRSRELWAERNQDVQAAAAELSEILRDDEDVAGALVALHEHETRLMLGVLGITMK